jgi:branched-chain amino acid transport system permease protein
MILHRLRDQRGARGARLRAGDADLSRKFSNGEYLGIAAFIAAIVGGFNQVRGAIVGGLLLGVVDNFAAAYLSAQYRAAIPLLLLIVVILFRPQGLLGRLEERTV